MTQVAPSKSHSSFPSAMTVPIPVLVKNAGMPAPPALIRSARVPCGLNSSSSSPERYCRSKSLFSPTYDEIIFLICRVSRRSPRPAPSTPALFEITVKSLTLRSRMAAISICGMPQRPNPPAMRVILSLRVPARGAGVSGHLLFMHGPRLRAFGFLARRPACHGAFTQSRLLQAGHGRVGDPCLISARLVGTGIVYMRGDDFARGGRAYAGLAPAMALPEMLRAPGTTFRRASRRSRDFWIWQVLQPVSGEGGGPMMVQVIADLPRQDAGA